MSKARQQRQSDAMRERILDIARAIVSTEGPEALSIRRITREMDYSAGSLYHYFHSKEEILHELLLEGYKRILASIPTPAQDGDPAQAIRSAMKNYITGVLQWPQEYRAVMFSSKPEILAVTSVLDTDVREKRKAMEWLIGTIERGVEQGRFSPCDSMLTAQAVWCAMFGMASRLIIEGSMAGERRDQLIERQMELLMKGLMV